MIQSILHLILIIVIVSLSIIKPLTSGLCLDGYLGFVYTLNEGDEVFGNLKGMIYVRT